MHNRPNSAKNPLLFIHTVYHIVFIERSKRQCIIISLKKRFLFDIQITIIIIEMDSCGIICESHDVSPQQERPR